MARKRREPTSESYTRTAAFSFWAARSLLPSFLTWDVLDSSTLPRTGPVIVACNHISNFDPPVLGVALRYLGRIPRFLAKAELFRVPLLGSALRRAGHIPVQRRAANASASLVAAGQVLDDGGCVVVFPEGTFTKDEELWPMRGKTGTVRLALKSGAPLIPVGIWGTADAYHPRAKLPRFGRRAKVTIVFGPQVDLSDLAGRDEDVDALRVGTERVMAAITALVVGLRQDAAVSTTR